MENELILLRENGCCLFDSPDFAAGLGLGAGGGALKKRQTMGSEMSADWWLSFLMTFVNNQITN